MSRRQIIICQSLYDNEDAPFTYAAFNKERGIAPGMFSFDEMREISGQTLAPVIDVDGEVLADFGPDELEKFWEKLKQK